jgi:hypothetical protein
MIRTDKSYITYVNEIKDEQVRDALKLKILQVMVKINENFQKENDFEGVEVQVIDSTNFHIIIKDREDYICILTFIDRKD